MSEGDNNALTRPASKSGLLEAGSQKPSKSGFLDPGSQKPAGSQKPVESGSAVIPLTKYADPDPSFVPTTAPSWLLGVLMLAAIAIEAGTSLLQKWMNKQEGPPCPDCEVRYFEAPNFFTFLMWVGELSCIFIWICDTQYSKSVGRVPPTDMVTNIVSYAKPRCPFYFWLLPCLFDYAASTALNYAFQWGHASTVQVLKNFNVIITAIISICYLQVALRRRHWISIFVISIGLVLTAMYALINPEEDHNDAKPTVGVILALLGTSISGFQVVFQESLFRKYYASPFEGVGWMGVFGVCISVVHLILCEYLGWEDVSGNFYMIRNSWQLLVGVFIYILFKLGINACALSIAKLGSAVLWQVVMAARSVVVWVLELIFQWTIFTWLSFSGMGLVTIGALYYNAILWPNSWTPEFWAWNKKPVIWSCCGCFTLKDPDAPAVPLGFEEENVARKLSDKESESV